MFSFRLLAPSDTSRILRSCARGLKPRLQRRSERLRCGDWAPRIALMSAACSLLMLILVGLSGLATAEQPPGTVEPITPIPHAPDDTSGRVALGETLFKDPRLSHDDRRACSACHDVEANGASAQAKDLSSSSEPLRVNTNTVFNAALSFRLNWTGNLHTLEEQAERSLTGPSLMATTWLELLDKLRADPVLVDRFRTVEGRDPDREGVITALTAYERTLLTPDSRFDKWLRGDPAALTAEELDGYSLFKSTGCAACHQGVNVGGNLLEKNGIFKPLLAGEPEVMRVPSLRNVATTPPYFHDGSAATLGSAIQRMAEAQLGRRFTGEQVHLVVAFLRSLTGQYRGKPVTAPQ